MMIGVIDVVADVAGVRKVHAVGAETSHEVAMGMVLPNINKLPKLLF